MAQCAGIKRDGGRCKAGVGEGEQWCYNHDPARHGERKRNASRAGKAKPSRELAAINARLKELAEDVLERRVDRANAAVAGQLFNYVLRGISVSLKAREQEELIERIEALEEREREYQEGRRWG